MPALIAEDDPRGLELGADDYPVKPFARQEFLARVRTLLRHQPGHGPELLRVADLELDPVRMKARRGGLPLDLTAKEYQVLSLLWQAKRRAGEHPGGFPGFRRGGPGPHLKFL